MPKQASARFTIADLRDARTTGHKVPVLTCYDFTSARILAEAGIQCLLVGDSASNVILGHSTTLPISLDFIIEMTAAVRRAAPDCLLIGDMPFGSYQASTAQGAKSAMRMVQLSGCDCVKLEVAASHAKLVSRLTDAGVAVMAHMGLRPQTVGLLGGYKAGGRTATEADALLALAQKMQQAGAAALLLEAVPPEVSAAVVAAVDVPVIGCGAGPACHGHVVVTHDILGLSPRPPRFAPVLADAAAPLRTAAKKWIDMINSGAYPAPEHQYQMPAEEKKKFKRI